MKFPPALGPTPRLIAPILTVLLLTGALLPPAAPAAPPAGAADTLATMVFTIPVQSFLAALKAKDLRGAYRHLAGRTQRHPRAGMTSFQAFLRANPALLDPGAFEVIAARPHRGIGLVEVHLQPAGGGTARAVHFELDQEEQGGRWGIDLIMPRGGGQFPKALIEP